MRPSGEVHVREPQGIINGLYEVFEENSFSISEPQPITDEALTPTCFYLSSLAKKNEYNSIYLPMEFVATPTLL